MAEGARLESVYTARYPGFESLSLRHNPFIFVNYKEHQIQIKGSCLTNHGAIALIVMTRELFGRCRDLSEKFGAIERLITQCHLFPSRMTGPFYKANPLLLFGVGLVR